MTAPLLQIEGLGIATTAGASILDDVSFAIGRGEFVAVVGESGSGKTAAARAVLGLLPAGLVRRRGRILLDGEDLTAAPPRRLRALRGPAMGMVFQEPMVSLNPALTVGAQMTEGLVLHQRLGRDAARRRSLDMLARVQIRDPARTFEAYPHEFSGGMRQRIMLASVMLLRPKLLIADEPTTALDTLTQREVLDLMVALARDHGTAVMLITHNLGLVARYAQRGVVLCRGRLVETGTAQQILTAPREAYTRDLVEALPRRAPARRSAGAGDIVMAVRGMKVAFAGRQRLFRRDPGLMAVKGVDLTIRAGETVAVVGGSGSGKTTLGRAMLRLLPLAAGEVRFLGRDVTAAADQDFRLAAQLVFQDPYSSLDPRMRIGDIVAEPLRHTTLSAVERTDRVAAMLDEVGLSGLARRFPHELSGGQRQRVAIARAIIRRPAFVVADEPVSALDMTIQAQVLKLFERLQAQYGFACLFISHDLAAVEQIADRVVVMQGGEIVEQGSRDEVFDRPQHDYTKALLAAAPIIAFSGQAGVPA
ncbi:peptide ABC transporter ATP-binding protein [Bradyrhizobium sp. SSBR45G]|uniref:dipeptide ABC transporter ATP-binding protein n=1 Tax=unclassified Bradyrhizobium TaxID=2631580 RepID=UPI002342981A|nr:MULTISPECIES: ABC transporter ATP-binding protein [unclassified Bradyrhizobium]GLH79845.1 peptide ABC transporter ATP-binding protein [Bradyrhizobium sp. SSBR45G]GLH87221.1 peptide ABC transporter ATP-binding protein [Bradyrhizobium sp. SSBR45R]